MIRRQSRYPLFPYTTLFRSDHCGPSAAGSACSTRRSLADGSFGRMTARRGSSSAITRSRVRSEEHTSELQSRQYLVCRLLLEKKRSKRDELLILLQYDSVYT